MCAARNLAIFFILAMFRAYITHFYVYKSHTKQGSDFSHSLLLTLFLPVSDFNFPQAACNLNKIFHFPENNP